MNNKIIYTIFLTAALFSTSCDKWIDVAPKTQIENSRFFVDARAFEEALNGVYITMGSPSLYGQELTFGLVDVLGGMYSLSPSYGSLQYREAFANGNYAGVESLTNGIWENSYSAIANLNNVLEQLELVGHDYLTETEYDRIKGESLGLRAFLHFDLLRLFTPSLAAGGLEAPGVPYKRSYDATVVSRGTMQQTLQYILTDLEESQKLLEVDPMYTSAGMLKTRNVYFNYYAVLALKARVYLWAGNKSEALAAAQEVIRVAPSKFPFVLQSDVAKSEIERDRIFTTENIFALNVIKLPTNYAALLEPGLSTSTLVIDFLRHNTQYEASAGNSIGNTDYRRMYLLRNNNLSGAQQRFYFSKLYQPTGMPATLSRRMPLIKIPEMYYIAAECLKDSNGPQAVSYINLVRRSRGIGTDLSTSMTADNIQRELRKEYWKEVPSEGQFFFYLKRNNVTDVPGVSPANSYPVGRYTLPLPQLEIDFGA